MRNHETIMPSTDDFLHDNPLCYIEGAHPFAGLATDAIGLAANAGGLTALAAVDRQVVRRISHKSKRGATL